MWVACTEGVPTPGRIVGIKLMDSLSGEIIETEAYMSPLVKWCCAEKHHNLESSLSVVVAWKNTGH